MSPNLINIFRLLGAKLMHTSDQHEVICINPSQFCKFRDFVFSAQNELESLRSENETLKNQITAYQLTIANMESEREAMMKQEPYKYFNEYNMSSVTVDQWKNSKDFQSYYELPLYRHPLPAQQMPAEDKS